MQAGAISPRFYLGFIGVLVVGGMVACGGGGSDDPPPSTPINTPIVNAPTNNAVFRVLSTVPDEDALSIRSDGAITIKFSSAVDSSTLTPNNIRVIHSVTRHPVDGALDFPDPQTVVFKPVAPLEYATHYEGLVRHYVTAQSGVHLPGSYRWEFTTEDPPITSLLHFSPEDGKQNVHPRSGVRVDFNTEMDASTVNSETFTLSDPAGALVSAAIEFDERTHTGLLRPTAALNSATTYTVKLSEAVKRSLGQAITPITWTFTTAAQATKTIQLGATRDDQYSALRVDQQGNRFLVHRTMVPPTPSPGPMPGPMPTPPGVGPDAPTTVEVKKYSSDGGLLWARDLGQSDVFDAELTFDSQGNLIVAGTGETAEPPTGNLGELDLVVWKLNGADGSVLWQSAFGTPDEDILGGVAVDNANDVYLAATTVPIPANPLAPTNEEALVIKLAGTGTGEMWRSKFGTPKTEVAAGIAVSDAGMVFVAGASDGPLDDQTNAGAFDGFIKRLSASDGAARGTVLVGTAASEEVHGLARAPSGLYLLGAAVATDANSSSEMEGKIWAFNPAGTQSSWTQTITGPALESVRFGALGSDGTLYVAGVMDFNFFAPTPPDVQGVEPPLFVAALDTAANGKVVWNTVLRGEPEAGVDHAISGHAEVTGLALSPANEPMLLSTLHGPGGFEGLTSRGFGDGFLFVLDPATGAVQ